MHTDTQIDPYILGLAVAAAPCFGYHDAAAASCGDCPVASRCVQARYQRAIQVAAQLLKKVVKDAPKTAQATVSAPAPATESIDDILASMAKGVSVPSHAPAPVAASPIDTTIDDLFPDLNGAPAPAPAPVADGPKLTKMKAVIDSVCYSCSGKIGKGTEAVFLPGKGLRHTDCP